MINSDRVLEEFIDALSQYPNLKTSPKTTSLYLSANPLPTDILKEQYNIDFILEGGIKVLDNENIISTRVIRTSDESILFNQKNKLDINDSHTIIENIAAAIYEKLSSEKTKQLSVEKQSKSYYVKGLHHWNKYTFEQLSLAISYFKRAIKLDDKFSDAYAALADCYCVIGVMGFDNSKNALEAAKHYVQKALQLNNKRSENFVSAALVDIYLSRDYPQAKINLSQALLLKKDNQKAHHVFAMYYIHNNNLVLAEKHALFNLKKAPNKIPHYDMLARIYLYQKNFAKGLVIIKKALAIDKESVELKELEGHLNMHSGNYEKAIECYQICHFKNPKAPLYYSNLAYIFSKSNYHFDSNKLIEDMEKLKVNIKNKGTFHYAESINKLGQLDYKGFFKQMNIAIENGLGLFIGDLIANPIYNEVKKDNRFKQLLKRLHLDETSPPKLKKRLPATQLNIQSLTKEVFNIDPQHIAFVESQGNYSKIYWFEDDILKNKLIRCILGNLEKQLSDFEYIIRCHKSYLINLNEALTISGNSKGYFFESNYFPIRIPISRGKANTILKKYNH